MQRLPVDSSDVVSVGYDPLESVLEIEFQGERIYQYFEVPQSTYDHFLKADSYGGYFNAHINSYYRYRRVDAAGQPKKYDAVAFVTGNRRKAQHLKDACKEFDINVEQLDLPVDEIQGTDPEKVALHKAKLAYKLAGRPVVVNDAFWNIMALRGFPGAYMKEITGWFRPEDFLALMEGKKDRSVTCTDTLTYYDGKRSKIFSKAHLGTIATQAKGKGHNSIDQIVIMENRDRTIAELVDDDMQRSVDLDKTVWYEFAKWYNMQCKLKLV
ncbi:MAG TPA: non-canonical purine NTP pyrophosphatase [Candidatus Saccharimonadales bacterium]